MWQQWKGLMLGFSKQEEEFGHCVRPWQRVAYGLQASISIRIAIFPRSFVCNPLYVIFSWPNNISSALEIELKACLCPVFQCSRIALWLQGARRRKIDCDWLYPLFSRIKTFWRALRGWRNPGCAALYVSTPTEWIGVWPGRVINRGRCWYEFMPPTVTCSLEFELCVNSSQQFSFKRQKCQNILLSEKHTWVTRADYFWVPTSLQMSFPSSPQLALSNSYVLRYEGLFKFVF